MERIACQASRMMDGVLSGSPRALSSWTTPARDGTSRSRWWSSAALESISAATSEAARKSLLVLGSASALARAGAQPRSRGACPPLRGRCILWRRRCAGGTDQHCADCRRDRRPSLLATSARARSAARARMRWWTQQGRAAWLWRKHPRPAGGSDSRRPKATARGEAASRDRACRAAPRRLDGVFPILASTRIGIGSTVVPWTTVMSIASVEDRLSAVAVMPS